VCRRSARLQSPVAQRRNTGTPFAFDQRVVGKASVACRILHLEDDIAPDCVGANGNVAGRLRRTMQSDVGRELLAQFIDKAQLGHRDGRVRCRRNPWNGDAAPLVGVALAKPVGPDEPMHRTGSAALASPFHLRSADKPADDRRQHDKAVLALVARSTSRTSPSSISAFRIVAP
jgi:hypothetical protein